MKFPQSVVLFAAALTIHCALANFHIVLLETKETNDTQNALWACASHTYNCASFDRGINGSSVTRDGQKLGTLAMQSSFSVQAGLCNMMQLNVYKDGAGENWNVYENKGNGSVVGICTPNRGHVTQCPTNKAEEKLLCNSPICAE
jgi:hypothetical protein